MPTYEFGCEDEEHPKIDVYLTFKEYDEWKDNIECPVCGKKMTKTTTFRGHMFVSGGGWRDKEGARRDMHKWTLQNKDPYDHMRQSGEVDDMVQRLEKVGKHDSPASENKILSNGEWVDADEYNKREREKSDYFDPEKLQKFRVKDGKLVPDVSDD